MVAKQHRVSLGAASLGRSTAMAALVSLLGGCTVLMVEPERPKVAERAAGLSYEVALVYLDNARLQMDKGLKEVDQLDMASRGAVGLGVGGAALTTLGRGPADVALGLLMVGGTGYSVNETSKFTVQASIYRAGLESLECIERNGQRVHAETGTAREQLLAKRKALGTAIAALAAAAEGARPKAATEGGLPAALAQADQVVQAGRALEKSVAEYVGATDVPTEMYFAVNKTVFAVNGQLRARAPNLAEIAQAGSLLNNFVANHSKLGSDVEAAKAVAKEKVVAQASSLTGTIHARLGELRVVIDDMQALLPAGGQSTASQVASACESLVPGKGVFAVKPAGTIQLVPGGEAYELSVDTDLLPVSYGFHGAVPSAQQVLVSHPGDRTFSLAAPAGARQATYRFYLSQKDGRQLPDMEVTVGAAPAVAVNRAGGPAGAGGGPPAGGSFTARRALIGLGSKVQSETDPAWTGRVKKLDNCFGIQPSDGTLREALVAQLGKHEQVNSAGDCPKPKPAGATTPAPAAPAPSAPASSPVVPIPAPPSLGASS